MDLRSSRYDPELQMFTDPPREPDLARLRFWRWLAERGLLERTPAGPPGGAYAVSVFVEDPDVSHRPSTVAGLISG